MKKFNLNTWEFGLIVGRRGYIVTETDFCHIVYDLYDTAGLRCGFGQEDFRQLALDELNAMSTPVAVSDFGHYWGVKWRVRDNYQGLLMSMADIEADTSGMPKWGDKDKEADHETEYDLLLARYDIGN